jgi:hypothetical protein
LGNVEADKELLKGAGVDQALSVDVDIIDEEEVVAVCKIEEAETNGGEDKDERSNACVANGYNNVLADAGERRTQVSLPMTSKLV